MAIKKYTNGSWVSASYRKYGTETDAITTLPTTVIGDGTPISSYTIKGNMEQSGTPTPSSPIYPSECGKRTENLFAASSTSATLGTVTVSNDNGKITVTGRASTTISSTNSAWKNAFTFRLKAGSYYFAGYFSDGIISYWRNANDDTKISMPNDSFVLSNDTDVYIGFWLSDNNNIVFNAMLNSGSTPLPYEPYGYKLPITLGSTTTNIYLGEVQSTRRIKKLVLTGTETWGYSAPNHIAYMSTPGSFLGEGVSVISTHYTAVSNKASYVQLSDKQCCLCVDITHLWIRDDDYSDITEFKAYLAAQYAAGTPVTVWYVLANPTTGIVNEPIRKIGDYVDSVSGTNLATSGTAQELDVDTTLKPSELNLTYHGWHEHGDTKFTT